MAFITTFVKDPDATLDYTLDWSDYLGGDEIATSAWVVPEGLTKVSESSTTTLATVWLSGGAAFTTYRVTNRVTTVGGREDDRSVLIQVRER